MVAVVRDGQFSIYVYTDDHPPAHVHARTRDGRIAKFNLHTYETIGDYTMRGHEITRVRHLIQENSDQLWEVWDEYHGD